MSSGHEIESHSTVLIDGSGARDYGVSIKEKTSCKHLGDSYALENTLKLQVFPIGPVPTNSLKEWNISLWGANPTT